MATLDMENKLMRYQQLDKEYIIETTNLREEISKKDEKINQQNNQIKIMADEIDKLNYVINSNREDFFVMFRAQQDEISSKDEQINIKNKQIKTSRTL